MPTTTAVTGSARSRRCSARPEPNGRSHVGGLPMSSDVVKDLGVEGAAEDQVGVAAAAGIWEAAEAAQGLELAAAPAFGCSEIADRPAQIDSEMQVAATVARADRDKGAVGAKPDDVGDAVAG